MLGFVKWESKNIRIGCTIYHHLSSNFSGGKPCYVGASELRFSSYILCYGLWPNTNTSGASSESKNGKCVNWYSSAAQTTQYFPAVKTHLYKNDGTINVHVTFVWQLGFWTLYCSPAGYIVQHSVLYHSICCNYKDNVINLLKKSVVAQMHLSLNLHDFNTLISELPIMSFNFLYLRLKTTMIFVQNNY
jgi:hypothetical protein